MLSQGEDLDELLEGFAVGFVFGEVKGFTQGKGANGLAVHAVAVLQGAVFADLGQEPVEAFFERLAVGGVVGR